MAAESDQQKNRVVSSGKRKKLRGLGNEYPHVHAYKPSDVVEYSIVLWNKVQYVKYIQGYAMYRHGWTGSWTSCGELSCHGRRICSGPIASRLNCCAVVGIRLVFWILGLIIIPINPIKSRLREQPYVSPEACKALAGSPLLGCREVTLKLSGGKLQLLYRTRF